MNKYTEYIKDSCKSILKTHKPIYKLAKEKFLEVMGLAMLQDSRSIYKNQLYFYTLATGKQPFLFFYFNFLMVDLQCCVNFWCTAKWLSYTHIYILFYILFHYGLSQDIEYSSQCYTVGPCCLSILYVIVGKQPFSKYHWQTAPQKRILRYKSNKICVGSVWWKLENTDKRNSELNMSKDT